MHVHSRPGSTIPVGAGTLIGSWRPSQGGYGQGQEMVQRDAKTGKEHREFLTIDMASGWETAAPGIEAKVLAGAIDEAAKKRAPKSYRALGPPCRDRCDPCPRFLEEVFVAAGTLLVATLEDCARFEAFAAPAFACRPPHDKHGPFKAGSEGCLLFETQFYY